MPDSSAAPYGGSATAPPTLIAVSVAPQAQTLTAGVSFQLIATATFSDGTSQDVTASARWSSSNTVVARVDGAGSVTARSEGTAIIFAESGTMTGQTAVTVDPLRLSAIKTVAVTTDAESGSARPEIIATADRTYVIYLGNTSAGANRTFSVKIFDTNLGTVIASKRIVSTDAQYGSPTDIRVAAEGQYLYAFYETASASKSYLHAAKYVLNDTFDSIVSPPSPIASGKSLTTFTEGDEILNDPAPLVGPDSVFVVTRLWSTIATAGRTIYRVRELSKDTMAQKRQFDLDLSAVADGRGRVTSLLHNGGDVYMALATTVSDQGVSDANIYSDDAAQSDIVLIRIRPDWTFDASADVFVLSAEPNDRENYITGLRSDGTYFYLTYKQAAGSPPSGEQRAVIKIFDKELNLLLKQVVMSVAWGAGGGEIRPSLEVRGNRIYSGQDNSRSLGTGNAEIYVYERN